MEEHEEIVNGNDDECYLCEGILNMISIYKLEGGQILCCDNCFRSFHMSCIKMKETPHGDWMCSYCKKLQQQTTEKCSNCEGSLSDSKHFEKLTCSKCLRK